MAAPSWIDRGFARGCFGMDGIIIVRVFVLLFKIDIPIAADTSHALIIPISLAWE